METRGDLAWNWAGGLGTGARLWSRTLNNLSVSSPIKCRCNKTFLVGLFGASHEVTSVKCLEQRPEHSRPPRASAVILSLSIPGPPAPRSPALALLPELPPEGLEPGPVLDAQWGLASSQLNQGPERQERRPRAAPG